MAVAGDVVMDQRGAGLQGRLHVEDRWQILVVHLDRRDGRGRLLGRERRHGRDDLALEAHDVTGEQRPVEDVVERAVAVLGDVVLGEDRQDAGQRTSPGRVQPHDPGVRPPGQQQFCVGQPRERQVGGVVRLPGRLGLAIGPDPARPFVDGGAAAGAPFPAWRSVSVTPRSSSPRRGVQATIRARLGCCGTGPYRGSAWRAVHGWCQDVALNRAGPSPTTPRPGPSDGAGAGRAPVQRGHPGNGLSVSNGGEY